MLVYLAGPGLFTQVSFLLDNGWEITTISDIRLDTYILFYDARNREPKIYA
jgi:hypothetical protein